MNFQFSILFIAEKTMKFSKDYGLEHDRYSIYMYIYGIFLVYFVNNYKKTF